ncbi:cupin-like domain-containing protein [Catenovulum sp. SX2]|uniref:cupin-like domain-containing protein n=1 Tax=Catenovulum sp. SX2 TaxID=3398614 RepID=UPI003F8658A9
MDIWQDMQKIPVYSEVENEFFWQKIFVDAKPAVLKGYAFNMPLLQQNSSDQHILDVLINSANQSPFEAFIADVSTKGRYFYNSQFNGYDFVRKPSSFRYLVDFIKSGLGKADFPHVYAGAIRIPQVFSSIREQFSLNLLSDVEDKLESLWVGNKTIVPAHWDLPQNLACVLVGKRRFTLFPPEQYANMYVGPIDNTIAGQPCSLVNLHKPDLEKFPNFAEAIKHAQYYDLEAGDVIFIPSMWFHQVEGLSDIGIMANFWWREGNPNLISPMLTLNHALLSLRELPATEKRIWQQIFDHYIFSDTGKSVDHIPTNALGVLGAASSDKFEFIKQQLIKTLKSTGEL